MAARTQNVGHDEQEYREGDNKIMIRVAILGATGYTARELLELLLRHPEVEVTALATRSEENLHVADVHPSLRSRLDLRLENLTPTEVAQRADCVFGCLPHGASAAVISELLAAGCRVIDFSADYRLNDPAVYEKWYQVVHPDPARMGKTVYGLPELFREQIRGAQLVANPGCYPTAAILALAPLLKAGAISPRGIIIDAKSGITGAGRTPKPNFHFPEANENLTPYNVGKHRHTPEIDQILSTWAKVETNVVFAPHLIPMDRGELVTAYADVPARTTGESLQEVLRAFYKSEPFVRIVDHLPGAGLKPTGMLDAVLTERLNNRSIRLIAVRLDAPTPAARQALVEAVAKQSLARRQVGVPVIVVAFVDTGELAAETRAFMTGEGLATPDLAQHSPRMIEISREGSASVFADRQLEGIVASDNEGQLNLPGGGGLGQVAVRRR